MVLVFMMPTNKKEIRTWAKEIQKNTTYLNDKTAVIISKIISLDQYKESNTILSYHSKINEVSLNTLLSDKQKTWFLPIVQGSDLVYGEYVDGKTNLTKNEFGIYEPEHYSNSNTKLDLIFVPGLCFDKRGYRVGYGLGFYDRFLKEHPTSIKIGICIKELLIDSIPHEEHDKKVDLVITD